MFVYVVFGMCLARPETYSALATLYSEITSSCRPQKRKVPSFKETVDQILTSQVSDTDSVSDSNSECSEIQYQTEFCDCDAPKAVSDQTVNECTETTEGSESIKED